MSTEDYDGAKASMKAAREVREWADGNLEDKVDNQFVYKHAGLVKSDKARRVLDRIAKAYVPKSPEAPREWYQLDIVDVILREQGTELVHDALRNGNMTLLDSLMGLINYDKDLGGVKAWAKIQNLITDYDMLIWYFYGFMGNGKTYFARLMVELWKTMNPDYRILSNVSMDDSEFVYKYSTIKNVLEERQGKDNQDRLLVFVDEAAQLFAGFGGGISRGEDMAKLLKLGRKADADFFFIGQDGKDITAQIRALCTSFVHKTAKKKAEFYADVKNREGIGQQLKVKNVPLPDNQPNTKEVSSLVFDDEDDEEITKEQFEQFKKEQEQKLIASMDLKCDLNQKELAELYDTNPRQIRRWKKKYNNYFEDLGLL